MLSRSFRLLIFLGYLFSVPGRVAGAGGGAFLNLGGSARAVALGEAYVAVVDDATAMFWNPGGLMGSGEGSVSFSHGVLLGDISQSQGAWAHRWGVGAIGFGVQYVDFGNVETVDSGDNRAGKLAPQDVSVGLSFAFPVLQTNVGVGGKYIRSALVDTATTGAVDVGIKNAHPFWGKLTMGGAVTNIGGKLNYEMESVSLPLLVKAGARFDVIRNGMVSFDYGVPRGEKDFFSGGIEYRAGLGNKTFLAIRLGYSTRNMNLPGISGWSTGMGFTLKGLEIDYSFVPYGDAGNTHRMSFGYRFGSEIKTESPRGQSGGQKSLAPLAPPFAPRIEPYTSHSGKAPFLANPAHR